MLWSVSVAGTMILLWGIIVPVIIVLYLSKNRNRLSQPDIQIRLSLMIRGYRFSSLSISWEVFFMIRKLLISIVVVFFPSISVGFSILSCLAIIGINLLLQLHVSPFEDERCNILEKSSLLSAWIVYFVGVYFSMIGNKYVDMVMIVTLFSVGISFILVWSVDYLRVVGMLSEGKIGNCLMRVLKDPENLNQRFENNRKVQLKEGIQSVERGNYAGITQLKKKNKFSFIK